MTNKHSSSLFEAQPSYLSDSFKQLHENGFNVVRVPFAWEAYEKDPNKFIAQAELIAYTADQHNICV